MAAHSYSYATVKAAARGQWRRVLERFGVGASFLVDRHGPCPGCGGKDRFRFDGAGGDGNFICSQGCGDLLSGDGFALLEHVHGRDWKHWVNQVGEYLGCEPWRAGDGERSTAGENVGVAETPEAAKRKRGVIDLEKVEGFVRGVPRVDAEFLRRRSAIDPRGVTSGDFLEAIFQRGERVLVFTEQFSQGDFLWEAGRGGFRLSPQMGVKATSSAVPTTGRVGAWYLCNPVTGLWVPKDGVEGKPAQWTRRSKGNVTEWRHFVLETDDLPDELWLRVLARLRLPIVAIYTSGRRGPHALLRQPVATKEEWDGVKRALAELLCPLGADEGAMTAVRLTRLPGVKREGTDKGGSYVKFSQPALQELLYLNPQAGFEAIEAMREVRG